MKVTRDQAGAIALLLKQQAQKHRELIGPASLYAEVFEKAAKALNKGEKLEVER